MSPRLTPALLGAALSACAVAGAPDLDRNVVPGPPAAWTSAPVHATGALERGWVASFADPALERAVETAFAGNLDLEAARHRLDAARALLRISRADLFPRAEFRAAATDPEGAATSYTGTLSASWEVDVWGEHLSAARAGGADYAAAAADFAATRLALAGTVVRAWHDLAAAEETVRLAAQDLDTRRDTLRITQARFDAGLASMLEVRLARVAVANSKDSLESRTRIAANSVRALEILLGGYPDGDLRAPSGLTPPAPLPAVTAPAAILTGRPDLIAAEARLDAQGFRAAEARAALLPGLTLDFSASADVSDAGRLFDPGRYVSAVAGRLLQPLFQGGALLAEADRQGDLARAALFDYAQLTLDAYGEVEDRLDAEDSFARQVEATRIAAEEARIAEDLTRRRYLAGQATIFDLLNAQATAIAAEIRAVESVRASLENRVQLHLALGDAPFLRPEPV